MTKYQERQSPPTGATEKASETKQDRCSPLVRDALFVSSDPFWSRLRAFTDFMKERQAERKAAYAADPNWQPPKGYVQEGILAMVSGLQLISQGVQRLEPCAPDQTLECHPGLQGGLVSMLVLPQA